MSPSIAILITAGYVGLLLGIGWWSSRRAGPQDMATDDRGFFVAGQSAPWYVVAFGMVGASLSGVTFLSIPGWVRSQEWTYLHMVAGYCIGYVIVASVLLPLYYKLGLTSIYGYLGQRFGRQAHKTGAAFFLLSRIIGASFRLFLVVLVLDVLILEPLAGGPSPWSWFMGTTASVLAIIYAYTRRGGMNTVIWTDTLQTACMHLDGTLRNAGHVSGARASCANRGQVVGEWGRGGVWV